MTVRAVEGKKPYTGGKAIEITEDKVINLRLRAENNLIIYDEGDDEIYVDLQLPDGIQPLDTFPVGITTGRVLVDDDWDVNGTIVCFKTTSGDNIKLLYGDDGKLYIDNGTGLFKQIYLKGEVDALLQALRDYVDAQLALKQDKLIAGENIAIAADGKTISAITPPLARFLSIWDCETGLPDSFPTTELPFEYITGDHYIVGTVDTTNTPPVNYRPYGTEFDGIASAVVESADVQPGDVYIYDGNQWLLQINHDKVVGFANIAGSPYDNTNLATALNSKADVTDVLTKNNTTSYTPSGDYNPTTKKYVDDSTAKVFYLPNDLTSASALSIAQDAYDLFDAGKTPIIVYKGKTCTVAYNNANGLAFRNARTLIDSSIYSSLGYSAIIQYEIYFTVSSGTVTSISKTEPESYFIDTTTQYTNPFTPTQNYHPTTKKYVDDKSTYVGSSAPSSPVEGQLWYDTTNDVLKSYDGTQWNATGKTYTAGDNVSIREVILYDTKGPSPEGYHVPLKSEWTSIHSILTSTFSLSNNSTTFGIYLKMPSAGLRAYSTSAVSEVNSSMQYWSSSANNNTNAYAMGGIINWASPSTSIPRSAGCNIRCIKDEPVTPDNTWTTLYDGSSVATGAGIFCNSSLGLISLSGNGSTWYTIQDKNLGATTVYNYGDTLSGANCGGYFQRGNNYMFPAFDSSETITTSSTQVDVTGYGPLNYYSSSTWITASPRNDSTDDGKNLRGGYTQSSGLYNVISATDTIYTAGNGINIDANNEISNTQPGPIVSASQPSSANEGDLWYDTTHDVLKTYNGTSWATLSYFQGMTILSYGNSTWNDFITAYNAKSIVYCRASSLADPSSGSQTRLAFMAYVSDATRPTSVEFQYYRSRSTHASAANQLDEVYVYKLTNANGGTRSVEVRDTGAKLVAGTGIGVTVDSSGATISNNGVTSVNGNTGAVTVTEFSPSGTATTGYVVTKTANGYEWAAPTGGDVMVSSQSGNILTSGMKIWAGVQSDYENLGTYDSNTVYLTI